MKTPNADRARILVHALPYIKKYNGKIVVIKYGGNAMTSEKLKDSVMRDIVLLSLIGVKVVLVHGGGPEITELLSKIGKKTTFVDGLRVTDKETVEAAQMGLTGKINKNLVNLIECRGGKSIGLSGIDGHMIKAKVKDERLGYVGSITDIRRLLTFWKRDISRWYQPWAATMMATSTTSMQTLPLPRSRGL